MSSMMVSIFRIKATNRMLVAIFGEAVVTEVQRREASNHIYPQRPVSEHRWRKWPATSFR
ncbi:uncharacterized protein TRIVIDRAFT_185359 [Trichoderma virens Gv29-8]|uniref:Uncharacterized protein n=1 Tax=Hypocrea virens (strain Gv29-8 / FGSC 10586) TaxID=413071 RepID=G9MFN5_HYPVG|nr:uncharacterized protein TRIVIDRAFT_185359 [Trichoderma virens Gv29-8]EHK26783.1 hypothetical protein TRIVIDRAFT_185359 [Trichoderma virens Gv29-8]